MSDEKSDEKTVEENWMSADWEAKAKHNADPQSAASDEALTKEVLDAEKKAKFEETKHLEDAELLQHDVPLPPPSLITLASGLATQAMISMGAFPNPLTGKTTMLLHQAAHLIDTIDLLYEKTSGNRTQEESKM
ncbi:MAG: DUF1844 domain-containing protein, partial [Planctomycetaceae bacterium]|nr:DUF1844 domain-containing protein [Planctomycetaceae bacterium]